ncbi:LysM peptidoglycan-binding domain-containing protein [Herbaspirillum huttiense]|uniref:transglycosylase SLT domain-containing protein n=1 Tax=Herbaspirillum huttiense TaxID=863372 RepID=UPI0003F6C56F|nr:transglycosylase SLT domain-containing protein [Herbaspirillum huttiense]QBP76729.1 LysM peptidoglycan-binding domain-containing protein [Herbaspirillum huttiense]
MQRTLKQLAIAALFCAGTPLLSHANDISIYPAPFNAINPELAGNALPGMNDIDIWTRIRKGFGIPDLDNSLVESQTQWYSSRPDYIQRTTVRASRYLFHVVQELEKRGMPTELALLPFIESAFNPEALSTAKAAGMWQFIPSTGRDYNLKQNMFTDERRDVLASTDAALTYLQKLYGMFGDWQLALAAYNWGEGSVQRAVNRNLAAGLPIDFNTLSAQMPNETRNYVPKLQAVKNIIANPAAFDIALPKVDNQPYFVTIGKTRNIDVKVAAQLAELSLDEFKALNPQFNRPVIIGGEDTKILLPESNAEKFKSNMSKWTQAFSTWTAHTVSSARERIETIASKFGTTPEVIRSVNQIPPRMVLKAGSTILVPKNEETAALDTDLTPEIADNARLAIAPDVPETRRIHVKAGKRDTLAGIASRYRVSVAQIKEWNGLKRDTLAAGQSLQLQVPNAAAHAAPTRVAATHHAAPARRQVASAKAPVRKAAPAPARKVAGKPLTLASGNGARKQ